MKKIQFVFLCTLLLLLRPWDANGQEGFDLFGLDDKPLTHYSVDDVIQKSPQLTRFRAVVRASQLGDFFSKSPRLTVFAPTEAAMARMDPKEYQLLLKNPSKAKEFVKNHVIPGWVTREKLSTVLSVRAWSGLSLKIEEQGLRVLGRDFVSYNQWCKNGVIHRIDGVLVRKK